jgi:hypothetical protein
MKAIKATPMETKQANDEALKQGVIPWRQYYHKPYELDWKTARIKALDKKWRALEK